MRIFIYSLMFCFSFTQVSGAAWFVVNTENEIVCKTDYRPDQKDLNAREEIAVEGEEILNIFEAEYRGGKIVKHKKTAEEQKEESDRKKKIDELNIVNKRALFNACKELSAEGASFTQISCEDYN